MTSRARRAALSVVCAGTLLLSACAPGGDEGEPGSTPPSTHAAPETTPRSPDEAPVDGDVDDGATTDAGPQDVDESDDVRGAAIRRPDWLGTRPLPLRPDGLGEMLDTPEELRDRRLPPPDTQPLADDATFSASVDVVSDAVAARSTWHDGCPVTLDDLRVVTVTFWGFDARTYRGELLVHHTVADDLVEVFRVMHDVRFPLEEMRIVSAGELDAPPTGDGNNTTGFVCRSTVQGSRWSEHARGLAVDVNPFHNPYVRGEVVVPELASAYVDRDDVRPGMVLRGDAVTQAFAAIGWGWGGDWRSASDPMHFSQSGR